MDEFKDAKKAYEDIPIPDELGGRVWAGVCQGRANRRRVQRWRLLRTVGSLAACFALLIGGLNLFPGFASAAADIPAFQEELPDAGKGLIRLPFVVGCGSAQKQAVRHAVLGGVDSLAVQKGTLALYGREKLPAVWLADHG